MSAIVRVHFTGESKAPARGSVLHKTKKCTALRGAARVNSLDMTKTMLLIRKKCKLCWAEETRPKERAFPRFVITGDGRFYQEEQPFADYHQFDEAQQAKVFRRPIDPAAIGDFFGNTGSERTLIPTELRYESRGVTVWEYPPMRMRVTTIDSANVRNTVSREIPLPWQIYVVAPGAAALGVFFRSAPLTSFDDELGFAYFANVRQQGWACYHMPQRLPKQDRYSHARDAINSFYAQSFNYDQYYYASNMPKEIQKIFGGRHGSWNPGEFYKAMEKYSVADVLKWKYERQTTLRALIDSLESQDDHPPRLSSAYYSILRLITGRYSGPAQEIGIDRFGVIDGAPAVRSDGRPVAKRAAR